MFDGLLVHFDYKRDKNVITYTYDRVGRSCRNISELPHLPTILSFWVELVGTYNSIIKIKKILTRSYSTFEAHPLHLGLSPEPRHEGQC
jgi:hypothetical protein